MVDKIKLDHSKKNIWEAFGISKERCEELMLLVAKAYKLNSTRSEVVESLWNSLELSTERACVLFLAGDIGRGPFKKTESIDSLMAMLLMEVGEKILSGDNPERRKR